MADTNTEPTVVSPNAVMAKPEGLATENDQVHSAGEQDRIRDIPQVRSPVENVDAPRSGRYNLSRV
jgi:hypothetical protein